MAAPHAIHEEFPHDAEIIHNLKISDNHFARLLDEYDTVNDEVAAAETNVQPTTEEHEHELRRKRSHLKDEIARMISAAKV
ncbi:MAG TPA: DUF465 domain-containing protein [Paracoccus sp. (in: a-proteobacteria)]|uniref:YdcH family protein n=1 Tax=uncultured Paracoccus sp. TaxID=189685 RepID=UPI002633A573|nr:DUF465 domain-containing protein [uncultured Paracoccus sp.]HMQ41053.1 DUF465 domain-containing protein [Paracoccus sp. (in: a-proteobacteria)]HMR34713.1 DUF465 domain-containing protein [Paracoccus sp. (in: a-proteobacteria)]